MSKTWFFCWWWFKNLFSFSNATLLVALSLSSIAAWYSIIGLTAIFAGAVIPIIIMGTVLEIAKVTTTVWLRKYWSLCSIVMKLYLVPAVVALALLTSMGIFGFLSKAHSDQSLVSGDVAAKIAVYDEKIKTEKENIEANRKALKQMDEGVDQVLGRSTDEKGADKAVAMRKSQQKERSRLQNEILQSQKSIAELNDARAPIAAEVRKVEAEVGPLKYIAAFVYGATDESVLERAVTWVIITIIVVFDPLAVIMLLAAQMTFGWKKEEEEVPLLHNTVPVHVTEVTQPKPQNDPTYEQDDGPLTDEQINQLKESVQRFNDAGEHPQDTFEHEHTEEEVPTETQPTALGGDITASEETVEGNSIDQWNKMIEEAEKAVQEEAVDIQGEAKKYSIIPELQEELDRIKPDLTEVIEPEESKKKTYMTKNEQGQMEIKNR